MRYEVRETVVPHPYKVWIDKPTGKRYPKNATGRGIWDRTEQKWLGDPSMGKAEYARLRELNGLPALTTAKVSAVLRKAHVRMSRWNSSSMVRGWGEWSGGAHVAYNDKGQIVVGYRYGHWAKVTKEEINTQIGKYAEILRAAGLHVDFNEKWEAVL